MAEQAKRPWYSFRWRILFWIALPFVLITLIEVFHGLVTYLISQP